MDIQKTCETIKERTRTYQNIKRKNNIIKYHKINLKNTRRHKKSENAIKHSKIQEICENTRTYKNILENHRNKNSHKNNIRTYKNTSENIRTI